MHEPPRRMTVGHDHEAHSATTPSSLTVFLTGAGASLRDATRQILATDPALRVVDPSRAAAREVDAAAKHPDVVLLEMDARLSSAEATVRELLGKWKPAPLLVLTECEDRACNRRLVRAGARGVVTQSRQNDHLVTALRRVHDGEIWLARGCMSQLIDEMVSADHPSPPHLATSRGLESLTDRERDVVELIARGLHNKAIATELGITDHTVRHHLTAIFAKLGVADRLELAVYAFRHAAGTRRR